MRRPQRAGFSFVEMLIVLAIMAIILSIAIPNLITAHSHASETVVAREVQTIHQAQFQYFSQFGEYASTLAELGPSKGSPAGPKAANLIPASLASGEKNGYVFVMSRTPLGFAVNANPKVYGKNGWRTFYVDQDGVVHQNRGREPATADSEEFH